MSLVSDIIERLDTISPPAFSFVGGAADFASIGSVPTATPAAYVLIEAEASAPTERATGPVLQRLESDVAVVIVAGNVSDFVGAAASQDIEDLKAIVRKALIGFTPACADDVVQHISGELLKAKNGFVWHKELFGTSTLLQEDLQ
ncbi:hypothetical protein [Mesorhizobium sp. ES1-1]|uniref:phage tail terminator protein n=1 Tax=Mesorhizobium sp. ES1-1 TaxID=2876629 RepID=UPI001CCE9FD6|nr:hypothetical protein [Mesorhizobium sp. ES1-1]MBZ9678896.1 hypothetical protein [Mesorhizobium sp. ES1-1]